MTRAKQVLGGPVRCFLSGAMVSQIPWRCAGRTAAKNREDQCVHRATDVHSATIVIESHKKLSYVRFAGFPSRHSTNPPIRALYDATKEISTLVTCFLLTCHRFRAIKIINEKELRHL